MTDSPTQPVNALTPKARRVAVMILIANLFMMAMKFGVFALTNSAAALSDALESIVNIVAAIIAIAVTHYASRPPDKEHPYGHGKAEFIAVALEGMMVSAAAVTIAYEAIRRWATGSKPEHVMLGALLLGGIALLTLALGAWVKAKGKRYQSATLISDGKHLMTDAVTTLGAMVGLVLVKWTGAAWVDPLAALLVAVWVFVVGGRLMRQSWSGLTDQMDPQDDATIRHILDEQVKAKHILAYHKVRHRHVGTFHWVDLHIQVEGDLTVRQAHDLASGIEYEIEQALGAAKASIHIEPPEAMS